MKVGKKLQNMKNFGVEKTLLFEYFQEQTLNQTFFFKKKKKGKVILLISEKKKKKKKKKKD